MSASKGVLKYHMVCVFCGKALPEPHHPVMAYCSPQCATRAAAARQRIRRGEEKERRRLDALAPKKLEKKARKKWTKKELLFVDHKCVDCGKPSADHRCPTCLAKWRFKHGVTDTEENDGYELGL